MVNNRKLTILLILLLFIMWVQEPIGRNTTAIDVDDGTLVDWVNAPVQLFDAMGETNQDMLDLVFVAFDFDDTWLYVRWDVINTTTFNKPDILYAKIPSLSIIERINSGFSNPNISI